MRGLLELLSSKLSSEAHANEVSYGADFTAIEQPPAPANDPTTGLPNSQQAVRFARIQAHSGDLVYKVQMAATAAPTYGTGFPRVFKGTSEIVQIPYGAKIYVGGVGGAVTGAVIFHY